MAIYNTDEVKIVAQISEANNDYITEGMTVTITKGTSTSSASSGAGATAQKPAAASAASSASPAAAASPSASASKATSGAASASSSAFTGIVTKKSLQATASNGVAYFETTITIQSKGSLSPGIYVTYSITAAQASNVILAPISALQKTSGGTCLFIKADQKPDNAVTLAEGVVPDGYYAVKVETGLSSNDYVEIKSGVREGVTVFEQYIEKNTTSGSNQTSKTSASPNSQQQSGMGQFNGPPGGFGGGGPWWQLRRRTMLIQIKDVCKIYAEGLESEVRALAGVSLNID